MSIGQSGTGIILGLILCFSPGKAFGSEPVLAIEMSGEWLNFRVENTASKDTWVLQHSAEGETWEDLIFLEPLFSIDFKSRFGKSFDRSILDGGGDGRAFFRAEKRDVVDLLYQEILAARALWKSAKIASYTYELSYRRGRSIWTGRSTVVNGVMTLTETLSSFPDQFGPPADLTIDGWFEKILLDRATGADDIEVTWDLEFGYPANGFIDLLRDLADEEESWTMSKFSPLE